VSDIRISPRYEGQSFVYRISDASYESDFYNQFLIAPAALVTEEVRKGLTQSRIFEYVINSSSQLQPTHRLDGIVNALYGDFRNISASRAVLEIEFFLSKQLPTGTEIVMNKRYSKAVPLSGRSPDALVKGWDEALDGILTSLIADLKSANSR
jgi:cholesterol transport system auxiliary component